MTTDAEVLALRGTHRCADCEAGLLAPWVGNPPPDYGKGHHTLVCSKNQDHRGIIKYRGTKKLADGRTYDVVTQQAIVPLPKTQGGMLERFKEAEAIGLWPSKMTEPQAVVLAQVALAYGLDPFMREIMPYQGSPYITISGRRRKDEDAGHYPSIRHRPLTHEEREWYEEAEVLNAGDLYGMTILTTERGNTVEAFWKVTKAERERKNDKGGLRSPVVASNPIEMGQKRGERRAREIAYGPIPMPRGLPTNVSIAQEGDFIEAEWKDVSAGLRRDVDSATGEIHQSQVPPVGNMSSPNEAAKPAANIPHNIPDLSHVPEAYREVVSEADGFGLDFEHFLKDILKEPSIEVFEKRGGNPAIASKRFSDWCKGEKAGE